MNKQEACKILEIDPNSSEEEVKRAFKRQALKYHPDVNKDPSAEDKIKKINEAYSVIQKGESNSQPHYHQGEPSWGGPVNLGDLFNQGRKRRRRNPEQIDLATKISFKDSIFGCRQEFKYERDSKCEECDGNGVFTLNNGCQQCQGRGVIISQQGNMIMQRTCGSCGGRQQTESCKNCSATGTIKVTSSISVSIPGGITDGNILRLEQMGNFVEAVNNMFGEGDIYTDAFVHISVEPKFGFSLSGSDVHTQLNITLLDALKGCNKIVETLEGNKEIVINPLTKNSDNVIISNLGVNRHGNQIVKINVEYPNNIKSLISELEK